MYLQIKLKLHLLLFYPSTWYFCAFFRFHIEIEGKGGWIIGRGEGGKGCVGPPCQISPPPPPPSYAYDNTTTCRNNNIKTRLL